MQDRFVVEMLPSRVVFGRGAAGSLPEELARLGSTRPALLSSPGQAGFARRVVDEAGIAPAGAIALATMHTPIEVTEVALAQLARIDADCLVAIGGGSAIGISKALALRTDLPQLCLPTTYAGSEVTAVIGETREGVKTTQKTLAVLPETVIYDVDLSLGLPIDVTMVSIMNAMAHAVEALYAQDRNPLIALLAREGVAAMLEALPMLVADPRDIPARTRALYGAWACGTCLGTVGMSLHHKLCHVLGGSFGLPHAETHSVVLPYAIAYNAPPGTPAHAELARLFGADDPARALHALGRRIGTPPSLAALGLPESAPAKVADAVLASPYWNPEPLDREALRSTLEDAWHGRPPRHHRQPQAVA